MKQFGAGLRRGALVSIFLMWALAGLPAILSAIVPTLPEVGTTEEASEATASAGYAADFDDSRVLAEYEDALAGRARLDFHPQFTADDSDVLSGVFPAWVISIFKTGTSEWERRVGSWHVRPDAEGELVISLDRERLNQDVVLELEFYSGAPAGSVVNGSGGTLFIDLLKADGEALIGPDGEKLSSERYGNLLDGSGETSDLIMWKTMIIPLADNPEAFFIQLRATGEIFLLGVYISQHSSGTTSEQEVPDSEAEQPVLEQPPAEGGTSGKAIPPLQEIGTAEPVSQSATVRRTVSLSRSTRPPPLQAVQTGGVTIQQFAMLRMADGDFVVQRSTSSGGGGRQTSARFILEDTFGQSSAIGFSYGANVTMHLGFQQAEAERLEVWNVGVTPRLRFNPALGETASLAYALSTEAKAVTVAVYDWHPQLVRMLVAQQPQNRGMHTIAWDGTDDAANLAADGTYQFFISATNYDGAGTNYVPGNLEEIQIMVADDLPLITSVADQPDPFWPDTAVTATISYVTVAPVGVDTLDMAIGVYADNLSGPPVRFWSAPTQPIGFNFVVWDGTDESGAELPDGIYVYAISNQAPPETRANQQIGTIMLLRTNTQTAASADGRVEVLYSGTAMLAIDQASPAEASPALFAIQTADPIQMLQSMIYKIEAVPSTNFATPALLVFQYDPAISGAIAENLQVRRYNETSGLWEIVPIQFIDYANHRILAEITALSLFAVFTGSDTTPPVIRLISPAAQEYYQDAVIDIIYEVEDPVVGSVSSGVAKVSTYLNGDFYPYASLAPANLRLGKNILTVEAYDGAGNIGRAGVVFTVILEAQLILKPEALNVNPGILTACVRLPAGWPAANITSATCDGALYERMMLRDDQTEMIIKFRRQDIEAALAEIGESIDTNFVVRGAWQAVPGVIYIFEGTDSIAKIVGAR